VRPVTGLVPDDYGSTLVFTTDHSTHVSVDVSFTVNAATYTVWYSPVSFSFGNVIEGYTAAPDAQTLAIFNTGNASLTLTLPTDSAYETTTTDSLTLAPSGAAAISIRPVTGLIADVYDSTLLFAADKGTGASVDVSFTVDAHSYTVGANPESLSFGDVIEGYSDAPDAQTVTITNTGNSSLELTLPTDGAYEITTADSLTLDPNGSANVSVRPITGLSPNPYDTTLVFTTDHSTNVSVDVTFLVSAASYTISVDPIYADFGENMVGYGPVAEGTFMVTNTGNKAVTLTDPSATNYTVSTLSTTTLEPNAFAIFTISPNTGLPAGTYPETIHISGTDGVDATVDVTFTVVPEPILYDMISGDNGVYHQNGTAGLVFEANGPFNLFLGIFVDESVVDESFYDASEGSTVIALHADYLDTLTLGTHMFYMVFMDGYAGASFSVAEAELSTTPDTGDHAPVVLFAALALISALLLIAFWRKWGRHKSR
jgi:hypothetical protein